MRDPVGRQIGLVVGLATFAPALWLMVRKPTLALACSMAVFFRSAFWLVSSGSPSGLWYFKPFAWQLLFVLGAWTPSVALNPFNRSFEARLALEEQMAPAMVRFDVVGNAEAMHPFADAFGDLVEILQRAGPGGSLGKSSAIRAAKPAHSRRRGAVDWTVEFGPRAVEMAGVPL
jgi:hypothetical protein